MPLPVQAAVPGQRQAPIRTASHEPKSREPLDEVLFLSDLDGTWLSKDPAQREALDRGVLELRDEYRQRGLDLKFGYITARPPARVTDENLPSPDWTITYNGGYIHRGEPGHYQAGGSYTIDPALEDWNRVHESSGFRSEVAQDVLAELLQEPDYSGLRMNLVGEVVGNPQADANPYVVSLCFDENTVRLSPEERADENGNGIPDLFEPESFAPPKQLEHLTEDLGHRLEERGLHYKLSPIYAFSGKPLVMFDAAAPRADKGDAVDFLKDHEHVPPDHLIVAGDGGNDIAMMRPAGGRDDGRRAIVVGNEQSLIEEARDLEHAIIRPAGEDSAAGVLAGLRQHLEEIAQARGL